MKIKQTNKTLEDTCSREVVGGFYAREMSSGVFFGEGGVVMNENIISADVMPKLCEVMSSGTKYAVALALTIDACHKAFKEGTSVTELEKNLKDLQKGVGVQLEVGKTTMRRDRPLKHKIGSCEIIELF